MNIQEIKQNYRIEEVIGQHISLKKQGPEMVGNCIFHSDNHASLKINPVKQKFKCFACGAGGDVLDFFELQGYSKSESMKLIQEKSIISITEHTPKIQEPVWVNAVPDQNNLPNPLLLNFKDYGNPSNAWVYHDKNGNIVSYVCRFDLPESKKDVIPYSYKSNGKTARWQWRGLDTPRLLYNLHELTIRKSAIVLLVEGEKTAEAAKLLFPKYVVTTWIGGADGVKNADWTPLHGRKIFLWADNDVPGLHAMFGGWAYNEKTEKYRRITGISEMFEASFKQIKNSAEFPKKWDVADTVWTPEEALTYLQANKSEVPIVSEHAPNEIPVTEKIEPIKTEIIEVIPPVFKPELPEEDEAENVPKNPYFKCLGHENNGGTIYVFFNYRTNSVIRFTSSNFSGSTILQLAPLNYWEGNYGKDGRSGVKYDIARITDNLISICSRLGIFDNNMIRGRGAWIDKKVPVIHCGSHLIVNGVAKKFSDYKSKYIYEAGKELGFNLIEPLKKHEAYKLVQMLSRLNWSRPLEAKLLAGWIVIAPLCGALNWRPHLWLTGASGSGKSEIIKMFVKNFMQEMFVDAQSETTEAGIRQFLKADALPVVFDEAESEDKRSAERMQSVLNIMRASSTSDGGKIIKGSSGGVAAEFNIRSCFAFSSIASAIHQRSDQSRITVLEILPDLSDNKKERWTETLKMYYETVTDEYIEGFQSRSVWLLPTILKNSKTFSNAASIVLNNQRTGDQLGILLAAYYSLTSESEISFDNAIEWMIKQDLSEEKLANESRDEIKLINHLMQCDTEVETSYGKVKRTIGELVIISRGDFISDAESSRISSDLANDTLKRLGMKTSGVYLIISDNSEKIKKFLENTSYSRNYHTILRRVESSEKLNNTTFGSYIKSNAVKIDTRLIFGEIENDKISKTEKELFS
jgi:putative DNA primase/helicase